jgi:hypothetical protein
MARRSPGHVLGFSLAALALLASAAAAGGTGTHVFRTAGIVVRYPAAWHVSTEPLTGIADPAQRVVLSSYPIPIGVASAGGYYAPPARGVLAQLDEEVPPLANDNRWPPRPHRFTLPRLGRMEGFGGKRWAELTFQQHRRRFYLFIGIGRRATAGQVRTLLAALDGMAIRARS